MLIMMVMMRKVIAIWMVTMMMTLRTLLDGLGHGDDDVDDEKDVNLFLSFSKALSCPMLMIFAGIARILGNSGLREEIFTLLV